MISVAGGDAFYCLLLIHIISVEKKNPDVHKFNWNILESFERTRVLLFCKAVGGNQFTSSSLQNY